MKTFNELVQESENGYIETMVESVRYFYIISLNWETTTIQVNQFKKGMNSDIHKPIQETIYRSLTGSSFFGTVSMEDKYLDIITNL